MALNTWTLVRLPGFKSHLLFLLIGYLSVPQSLSLRITLGYCVLPWVTVKNELN